jgi:hypothetical protein
MPDYRKEESICGPAYKNEKYQKKTSSKHRIRHNSLIIDPHPCLPGLYGETCIK